MGGCVAHRAALAEMQQRSPKPAVLCTAGACAHTAPTPPSGGPPPAHPLPPPLLSRRNSCSSRACLGPCCPATQHPSSPTRVLVPLPLRPPRHSCPSCACSRPCCPTPPSGASPSLWACWPLPGASPATSWRGERAQRPVGRRWDSQRAVLGLCHASRAQPHGVVSGPALARAGASGLSRPAAGREAAVLGKPPSSDAAPCPLPPPPPPTRRLVPDLSDVRRRAGETEANLEVGGLEAAWCDVY